MTASAVETPLQVVGFRLGEHRLAIPIRDTVEVLPSLESTPLPRGPAVLEGVVDVRGQLVAVLNARERLGLPKRPPACTDHLILARADGRPVALRVDAVTGIVQLDPRDVREATRLSPGLDFIAAVARGSESIMLIHDLATFLSRAEADQLDQALLARAGVPA